MKMEIFDYDEISQLFEKFLYAIKNKRRRLILEAFNESETWSVKDLRKYSIEKSFFPRRTRLNEIKRFYLKPWVEVGVIRELEGELFKITDFGKNIREIISQSKELNSLKPSSCQTFYDEKFLLELRNGKKSYRELTLKVNSSDPIRDIKRLKDRGLVKIVHPKNLLRASSYSKFRISPYYYFIEFLRNWQKETQRSWFTEFSLILALNRKWLEIFGRPLDFNEMHKLIERGLELGEIVKNNGSYSLGSIKKLLPSELKILELVKNGYRDWSTISAKIGRNPARIRKILKKLERRMLLEREREIVTIELTERGKKLADALFKIRESLREHLKRRVEIDAGISQPLS
jgi:predicted transcriptional regulator